MAETKDAPAQTAPARQHKATYARDKRKGGYLVRVQGPHADKFADREVPVERKDGSEQMEKLEGLIWSGIDTETGGNVALYKFAPRPQEQEVFEF